MLETPQQRVRAGFSLAIVTLVVIFGSLVLSKLDCLRGHIPIILLGFGLSGAVLFFCGGRKTSSSEVPVDPVQDKIVTEGEHPLAFLGKSGYWAWVILISTIPIFFLAHLLMPLKKPTKSQPRRKVVAKVAQPPPPALVTAPATGFPDLKLTGFVCNGTRSTAVINGSTIEIGRGVENVTLVAVENWGAVIVEMNGVKKRINMGE